MLRFHILLIEADVWVSRIRLSDKHSVAHHTHIALGRGPWRLPEMLDLLGIVRCSAPIPRPLPLPTPPSLSLNGFRLTSFLVTSPGLSCCVTSPCAAMPSSLTSRHTSCFPVVWPSARASRLPRWYAVGRGELRTAPPSRAVATQFVRRHRSGPDPRGPQFRSASSDLSPHFPPPRNSLPPLANRRRRLPRRTNRLQIGCVPADGGGLDGGQATISAAWSLKRRRSRAITSLCIWLTRDSERSKTSPISAMVSPSV